MEERAETGLINNALVFDGLWDSFRNGDERAFEEIFKTYYPVLKQYGMRLVGDEAEVQDSIQALFLQIWDRRKFLGPTTSIRNYLLAAVRRSLLKKAGRTSSLDIDDHLDFHAELSVEHAFIRDHTESENARLIRAAFDRIPSRQKEAIYLRFYEEQDFDQISGIMNISTRAVYKLIYKGLNSLQSHLSRKHIDLTYLLPVPFYQLAGWF